MILWFYAMTMSFPTSFSSFSMNKTKNLKKQKITHPWICTGIFVVISSHKHIFYQCQWNQTEASVVSFSLPVKGKSAAHQRSWHIFLGEMSMNSRAVGFIPAFSSLVVFPTSKVSTIIPLPTDADTSNVAFAKFMWGKHFKRWKSCQTFFI